MVPESERLELLAHQRPVDLIYLKDEEDPRWGADQGGAARRARAHRGPLLQPEQQRSCCEFCGRIEVVERQASVTTSERIRQMYMHLGERLGPKLAEVLPGPDRQHPAARMSQVAVAYVPVLHEGYRRFSSATPRPARCT